MRKKLGFTLVEYLVYIAIVSTVVLAATEIVIIVLRQNVKLEAMAEVSQNSRMVVDRLHLEVKNAQSIVSPSVGATSTMLSLQMSDPVISPTVFTVQNGSVYLKRGTAATTTLTASEVSVVGYFYNITPTGMPGSIRFLANFASKPDGQQIEYLFNSFVSSTSVVRRRI